jgi:hypothetical protein
MREAYAKLTEAVGGTIPCREDAHSGALVWRLPDGSALLVNDPRSHRLLAGEAATGWLVGTEDFMGYPTGDSVVVPTFRGTVAVVRGWLADGTPGAIRREPVGMTEAEAEVEAVRIFGPVPWTGALR